MSDAAAAASAAAASSPSAATPLPPTPLPPYTFDPSLSDDENYLTWSVILSRHSFSRRGHMGALIVQPATSDRRSQLLVHAVNTPLLYTTGHPRNVSEIHAEAHCLSLAARRGVSLDGCTAYVTFPPCLECFKLLVIAGIRRIVFRKGYNLACSDAVLVTAEVWGVELVGTTVGYIQDPLNPWDAELEEQVRNEIDSLTEDEKRSHLDRLLTIDIDTLSPREKLQITHLSWTLDRLVDRQRDERARTFWSDTVNETANETRQRSTEWWERWQTLYRKAARKLREQNRGGFMEKERKAAKKERTKNVGERKREEKQQRQVEAPVDMDGPVENLDAEALVEPGQPIAKPPTP